MWRDIMSTSEGYHEYIGGYHDECGGYHLGMFSTSEGYHEYTMGCSVHRRDTMMMHVGGYHNSCGGYHDSCGGYHEYIGDVQYIEGIPLCMWRDIMIHVGGYHEYIRVCSVHGGFQYK